MSRRSRARQRAIAAAAALPVAPVGTVADITPRSEATPRVGGGGYQAAWQSDQRGYIYWPSLDPEREIDSYSRQEIARRAHWCCAHLGLARRVRTCLVNLIVGAGLTPKSLNKGTVPGTSDKWAPLADRYHASIFNSALAYDVRGRLTGRKAQRMRVATKVVDGDAFTVRSRSESGAAQRAFYSGLAVSGQQGTSNMWRDGALLDRQGRIIAWRFPQKDGGARILPASAVSHYGNIETLGQIRCMSGFAHAVSKMTDITEVNAAVMKGIKLSSQPGYYITKQVGSPEGKGMEDRHRLGGKATVTDLTGKAIDLKAVYGTGGEVPNLPPGHELKMLVNQNPSENTREFIWSFIQDCAWGFGVAPELLWNSVKLGSANQRFVMADAQTFVTTEQQDLVDQELSPDWVDIIACGLENGDLPYPEGDDEWWANGWIPPERMTVDFSKDGAIMLKQHQAGLLTAQRWFALRGQNAYDETTDHLDFIEWRKAEMARRGLTYQECYPAQPGSPVAQMDPPAADPAAHGEPDPDDEL